MTIPHSEFDMALAAGMHKHATAEMARFILPLLDLTRLEEDEDYSAVEKLCGEAAGVAAVCIYPRFIPTAKKVLQNTDVKIATVCNFPSGKESLEKVLEEIERCKELGADEIDVVFPYEAFLKGEKDFVQKFLTNTREACGKLTLKMILETGALISRENILGASFLCLDAGADFLKTSTGKISVGATLEAATDMLLAIKHRQSSAGFKASGGVKTVENASQYIAITKHIMGDNWITPETFRFGASSLLKDIQQICG